MRARGARKGPRTAARGLLLALALAACGQSQDVPDTEPDQAVTADRTQPAGPDTLPGAGATADGPADTMGNWTAGRSGADREPAGVATLRDVRSARHDGFDRVVLDFGDDPVPSWEVEYVDRPVRQCGSGDAVELAGDGWLRIHVQPARGHDDEGRSTVGERRRQPDLPVLAELVATCDFEAHVEWVAGVRSPNRYRVLELTAPSRLVVDVRH